jgi:predicted transcriptional regulator
MTSASINQKVFLNKQDTITGLTMKHDSKTRSKLHTAELKARRRRRERHELVMEILKTAKNGARKTHIMKKVGLSYAQLKEYLNALKGGGFLTDKSGILKTTEKGFHAIEACEICHRLIKKV